MNSYNKEIKVSNKRVLLISNAYYPSIGGIENSLRHLAEEALDVGDEVKIIVSDICLPDGWVNRHKEMVDGVLVERYSLKPCSVFPFSLFNIIVSNWCLYKKLRKEFKAAPNTVVIARYHFAALLSSYAGFKNVRYLIPSIYANQVKVESAVGIKNQLSGKVKYLLHDFIQKLAILRSDNYVFSRSMVEQCQQVINNRVKSFVLTKPGVDFKRFYPIEDKDKLKHKLNVPVNIPIVLFVGRLVKAKGCDLLIEAILQLDTPCHLVIVGEGNEEGKLRGIIASKNKIQRVQFIPATRKVEEYYQVADVFAMSSNYEPLGQTILEALACGLTIVAFKNGSNVNTATQELGIDDVVEYADTYTAASLQSALEKSLKLVGNQDISHGVNLAKRNFGWDRLYKTLLEDKVIKGA